MSSAFVETELQAAGFDAAAVERIRRVLAGTVDAAAQEALAAGPVRIDPRTRRVTLNDQRVTVSQKEFDLLLALARDPERVFTKEELLRNVWGYRSGCRTRTLDSHVSRLRRKFRALDPTAELVVNVWGVGYRLLDR